MSSSSTSLTPTQAHALFDVLVHHQLYAEIESFKSPDAIDNYGYPFKKADGVQTRSPLLQNMLNKFALILPGLNSVSLQFWQEKVSVLVRKMAEAELSESYDKGTIGARKALATAISSLLEYIGRGILGGYPKKAAVDRKRQYDITKAEDIVHAWENALQELVYSDLLDELFDRTAESGRLEDHSPLVQATHEFILLNLASFMHHIFVMSPDGQYLLHIIENVHRLVPYPVLRQTLRVGNAATMINGVVKLFLTKLSVTAVTNWIGWTNNANDGMNLMQQIISQVMAWDTADFQRRASKLEHAKDAPDKQAFTAVRSHVQADRKIHDKVREKSIAQSKSIIAIIMELAEPPVDTASLTQHQHEVLQEYYSTLLSIRDREELTKILCKMQPDLLTSSVRDLVAAFDPIIRAVHNAVDLSGTVSDLQAFLDDLIKISKPKKNTSNSRNNSRSSSPSANGVPDPESENHHDALLPTVEDYVQLIRKHIPSSHKFLHQVCKNAPDLAQQYRDYAKSCVTEFRVRESQQPAASNNHDKRISHNSKDSNAAAGTITPVLNTLFSSLTPDQQSQVLPLLSHHASHLSHLNSTSSTRLKTLLAASSNSSPKHKKSHARERGALHGPGVFLARWHALLDEALITPQTLEGPVRRGREVKAESRGRAGGDVKGGKAEVLAKGDKERKLKRANDADKKAAKKEHENKMERGRDEVETEEVWRIMREGWEGVVRGLEVMGD